MLKKISLLLLCTLLLTGCSANVKNMSMDEFAEHLGGLGCKYIKHNYVTGVNGDEILHLYVKANANSPIVIYDSALQIFEKAFKKDIDEIVVYWKGKGVSYNVAKFGLSRGRYESINWDAMYQKKIPQIADPSWLAPAIE